MEYGFLDNAIDREKLKRPDFRKRLAKAAAKGVINYFQEHQSRLENDNASTKTFGEETTVLDGLKEAVLHLTDAKGNTFRYHFEKVSNITEKE